MTTPTAVSSEPRPDISARGATTPRLRAVPEISVVIPGLNEEESLAELADRIATALSGRSYEVIFVDDGSTDNTWGIIGSLSRSDPRVRGLRLRKNFGKAMGLAAGFRAARGEVVITMDADLQDDPADLPKFLAKLAEGADVVVGWKVSRRDPLNRRVLSKIFNGTVSLITGVHLHDMNCGFKAYRREVLRALPVYGDLFRFIPVFAAWHGFTLAEVEVNHHERRYGRSRYGLERIMRGFLDLLSVTFLTRYSHKPMHLFGLMGLVLGVIGAGICGYLSYSWMLGEAIGNRPLLMLGVLTIIVGIQFFSMGLIGEYLAFQYLRQDVREHLPIREEIGEPAEGGGSPPGGP